MIFLRSTFFNVFFLLWTFGLALICLPLLLLSRHLTSRAMRIWGRGSLTALEFFCNIKTEIRGTEHISNLPVIYASKHQSAWDILIFNALLYNPSFILKKQLLYLPLMGFYMIGLGMIPIDRQNGSQAINKMLKYAKDALHRRQPIVIFPEGTRTKPGADSRYRSGVATMYDALKVTVIPVALNSGRCWAKNAYLKKPGIITIQFLPPISPGLTRQEFLHSLKETIETKCVLLNQAQPAKDTPPHFIGYTS